MVVDTQKIIERAHLGDMDYVKHALTLLTDFIGAFVRILVIMVSCSSFWLKKHLSSLANFQNRTRTNSQINH